MTNTRTIYLTKGKALIGRCVEGADGWRFFPNNAARKPSKKAWATANECIPAWAMDMADDMLTEFEFRAKAKAA